METEKCEPETKGIQSGFTAIERRDHVKEVTEFFAPKFASIRNITRQ
jgi:hypothetical protein